MLQNWKIYRWAISYWGIQMEHCSLFVFFSEILKSLMYNEVAHWLKNA